MSVRSAAAFLIKILITLIVLVMALRHVEASALGDSLSKISLPILCIAIVLSVPLIATAAQRWRVVATVFDEPLPFGAALYFSLIAQFLNLGLPTVLGFDAVRTWKLRQYVSSLGLATRIVVADRICSSVALLLIIGIGIPHVARLSDSIVSNTVIPLVFTAAGGFILSLISLKHWRNFPSKIAVLRPLFQLSIDCNNLITAGHAAKSEICLWASLNHLIRVAMVFFVALSLNLNMSPIDVFSLVPISLLIAMIPISLGGWGVREAVFINAFSLAGVAPASALALSVVYGLIGLITALTGGAIWMLEQRMLKGRVSSQSVRP